MEVVDHRHPCLAMEIPLPDIRWKQRLNNFFQALSQLENAVQLMDSRALNELEKPIEA